MEELDLAAEYIATRFRSHGLEAAGDGGTYLQRFELTTGAEMGDSNSLQVDRNSGSTDLKLGDDFVPINFSLAAGSRERLSLRAMERQPMNWGTTITSTSTSATRLS